MYRVDVSEEARATISALPAEVLAEVAETFVVLEIAPWSGLPQNDDNPEGAVRHLLFGPAMSGQIVYLILENTRGVEVLRILWLDA